MEEGDYRASHTPLTPHPHTAPGLHQHMHTHVSSPTLEVGLGGERGGGQLSLLDLLRDLQVSPVDGEQCAVRGRGAQLPGAVGHVPVSQEDQWGEGGDLAGEGTLLCRRKEGRGTAFHLHTHSHLTHILCQQWCEFVFHSHCTSTPWTIGIPSHPSHSC